MLALIAVQVNMALGLLGATSWPDPSPHLVRYVAVTPTVKLEVLDWGGPDLRWSFLP